MSIQLEFSIYNSVDTNREILENKYNLFLSGELYPNNPISEINTEVLFSSDREKVITIRKWMDELKEHLKRWYLPNKRDKIEKEQFDLLNSVIVNGVYEPTKHVMHYLTRDQIYMIVSGSQEVFKALYEYKYEDKLYKELIEWFEPVDFVLSVIIGYIYEINTLPENFVNKTIEKQQVVYEENLVTEESDKKDDKKKSFYPFDVNYYQNKTIQRIGTDKRRKQIMGLGPILRNYDSEDLIKRIILVLYGSDLWIKGLMNMISGFESKLWGDFVGDQFRVIKGLSNENIQKSMNKFVSENNYDINRNREHFNIYYQRALNETINKWRQNIVCRCSCSKSLW